MYMYYRYTDTVTHDTIILYLCNTVIRYTIPLDTVISYICITATRILCIQLFYVQITLLLRFTCIPALIFVVFILHGSLFMLPGLPLLKYSCTPATVYTYSCYCITDKILLTCYMLYTLLFSHLTCILVTLLLAQSH